MDDEKTYALHSEIMRVCEKSINSSNLSSYDIYHTLILALVEVSAENGIEQEDLINDIKTIHDALCDSSK